MGESFFIFLFFYPIVPKPYFIDGVFEGIKDSNSNGEDVIFTEDIEDAADKGGYNNADLIEEVSVVENTNGTAEGIALVINGGKVVKATKCSFKGEAYGVKMLLKGVFDVALELEDCDVEGGTAAIAAYDEKGISNTSGSLVLTYDAATVLTGALIWDFEDECKGVVTLNQPE